MKPSLTLQTAGLIRLKDNSQIRTTRQLSSVTETQKDAQMQENGAKFGIERSISRQYQCL